MPKHEHGMADILVIRVGDRAAPLKRDGADGRFRLRSAHGYPDDKTRQVPRSRSIPQIPFGRRIALFAIGSLVGHRQCQFIPDSFLVIAYRLPRRIVGKPCTYGRFHGITDSECGIAAIFQNQHG